MENVKEGLKNRINQYTTNKIVECLFELGAGVLDIDAMMVRAALLDVYEDRMGEEAADELMDKLGL